MPAARHPDHGGSFPPFWTGHQLSRLRDFTTKKHRNRFAANITAHCSN
jgi:hypothetical protein